MISLTPIITLLQQATPSMPAGLTWFRQVEGAGALARLTGDNQAPLPGCWVVRAGDSSRADGERSSVTIVRFDVVLAVANHRIASAGDSDDQLLIYRRHICERLQDLAAWPDTDSAQLLEPIRRLEGEPVHYAGGNLWWRDKYQAQVRITNYLSDPPDFAAVHYGGRQ